MPHLVLSRRALLAAPALAASSPLRAQNFPDRPIKVVVAYAPGGAADLMARAVAQQMGQLLGTTVIVDNRSGATGAIGAQTVAGAAADGYTLLFGSGSELSVQPLVQKSLPYNADRDFVPISLLGITPIVIAVHAPLPAQDVPSLVALARQKPLSFASSGTGTVNHLTGELFAVRAGVKLLHVPYRGTGQAVSDAASGQVDMIFAGIPAVLPQVQTGHLRILAVSTAKRSAAAPEVPTLAEAGFAGFDMSNWFGLMAPAGTPPAVLEKLGETARATAREPAIQALFKRLGGEALETTGQQFGSFIAGERVRLAEAVKAAHLEASVKKDQ